MSDHLRDDRETGFYIVDNDVLDKYAPRIGVYGVAVYSVIVRYANRNNSAFPSYQTIANKLDISRPKVIDTIKVLVEVGLIRKEQRFDEAGDATSNTYIVVDLKGGKQDLLPSQPDLPRGKQDLPPVVNKVNRGGKQRLPEQDLINNTQSEQDVERDLSYTAQPIADNPAASLSPKFTLPEKSLVPHKPQFSSNGSSSKPAHPPLKLDSPHLDPRRFANGYIPPGQGRNAVEVWYERYSIREHRLSAPLEDDIARAVTDLDLWRRVVMDWQQHGYKPLNVRGQLEWYANGGKPDAKQSNSRDRPARAVPDGYVDLATYESGPILNLPKHLQPH